MKYALWQQVVPVISRNKSKAVGGSIAPIAGSVGPI